MKALWICLCLFVIAAEGQKEKREFRVPYSPPHFYTAEEFLEMDEASRGLYASGLIDGFGASTLFGATDESVRTLASCIKGMDSKQIAAIIAKYVQDRPEIWHVALSIEAYAALNRACPGGLQVE